MESTSNKLYVFWIDLYSVMLGAKINNVFFVPIFMARLIIYIVIGYQDIRGKGFRDRNFLTIRINILIEKY